MDGGPNAKDCGCGCIQLSLRLPQSLDLRIKTFFAGSNCWGVLLKENGRHQSKDSLGLSKRSIVTLNSAKLQKLVCKCMYIHYCYHINGRRDLCHFVKQVTIIGAKKFTRYCYNIGSWITILICEPYQLK